MPLAITDSQELQPIAELRKTNYKLQHVERLSFDAPTQRTIMFLCGLEECGPLIQTGLCGLWRLFGSRRRPYTTDGLAPLEKENEPLLCSGAECTSSLYRTRAILIVERFAGFYVTPSAPAKIV